MCEQECEKNEFNDQPKRLCFNGLGTKSYIDLCSRGIYSTTEAAI